MQVPTRRRQVPSFLSAAGGGLNRPLPTNVNSNFRTRLEGDLGLGALCHYRTYISAALYMKYDYLITARTKRLSIVHKLLLDPILDLQADFQANFASLHGVFCTISTNQRHRQDRETTNQASALTKFQERFRKFGGS